MREAVKHNDIVVLEELWEVIVSGAVTAKVANAISNTDKHTIDTLS